MRLVPDPLRARHTGGVVPPTRARTAAVLLKGTGSSRRGAGAAGALQRGLWGLVPSPPSLASLCPSPSLPAKEAPTAPTPRKVPGGKSGSDF